MPTSSAKRKVTIPTGASKVSFQFTKLAHPSQQFVRLDDIAFTVAFMGINDPAPTITRDCAAVAPRPTCRLRKISDQLWCRFLSNQLEVNKAAQQVVANNPQNCSLKSSLGCRRTGINFVNGIFFSTFDVSASTRSGFSKPRSRKLDPLALLPEASG